jgi:hypothetical protein
MFLHWHHKSVQEQVLLGNTFFYASGRLFYILNDQITQVATFPSAQGRAAWTVGGQYITTASASNAFNFYEVNGANITALSGPAVYPSSGSYGYHSWDPTGTYLAISSGSSRPTQWIYKRNQNTLTLLTTINHQNGSGYVAWSPNSQWLCFVGFPNTENDPIQPSRSVFLYNRSGDTFTLSSSLTANNTHNSGVAWNADGSKIALNVGGVSNEIARVYTQSGSSFSFERTITATNPSPVNANTGNSVAWTSDGRLAIGFTDGLGQTKLTIANPTAGPVYSISTNASTLSWSKDGKYLAASGLINSSQIYSVNDDELTVLTTNNPNGPIEFIR